MPVADGQGGGADLTHGAPEGRAHLSEAAQDRVTPPCSIGSSAAIQPRIPFERTQTLT